MKRIDILLVSCILMLSNQVIAQDNDLIEDINDGYLRENPDFDIDAQSDDSIMDLSLYPFIKTASNIINLNGSDWSSLTAAAALSEQQPLRILHIGDSHIQADMATGYARRLFQDRFGSAGRGLIVPYRLAGTNEPHDYSIRSSTAFDYEKLLSYPWTSSMGFTGISLTPKSGEFDFDISAKESFERVYIYYNGAPPAIKSVSSDGSQLVYSVSDNYPGCVELSLPFPCDEINVICSSAGDVSIYGMELVSDVIGVIYNTIGVNGATYSCYNRVENFGKSISMLEPQLIVISLGTNEAFGRFDRSDFTHQIDVLVSDLKMNNPEACILLVTPAECQRRIRRKGRRSYTVNKNIEIIRSAINDYGKEHGVAVYDWYQAAGGEGASSKWIASRLFSRDRIHYSLKGYELTGFLLYSAIINAITTPQFND